MNTKIKKAQPINNKLFTKLQLFGLGKERDYFLENISALLASGMSITDAILAVRAEIKSKKLQKVIDELGEDIQIGLPLSEALKNTGMFSAHISSLVRIGEKSGKLVENLKILSIEQAKERTLKSKLRSATMYPFFVFSLTLIVGTGIAWFILPKLAIVFSQLKLKLPLITEILINTGLFLNVHGSYVIPAFFLGLIIFFYFLFYFSKTKFIGEVVLFLIPGIKSLLKETELARFGYLMGTLLSAGLSPVEALHSLSEATSLSRYKKFYLYLQESIAEGNSFKKSFSQYKKIYKLFPVPIQQLIISGEQSGTLSLTLIKVGQDYEAKTDATAKDLTIILEPILLVIVWLGVLAVAFAVILPIYSLVGGFNNGGMGNETPAPPVGEEVSIVLPDNPSTDPIATTPEPIVTIETMLRVLPNSLGYLNVRSEPGLDGEIITKILPEASYEYSSIEDGWYQIMLPEGVSGWVLGKYIEVIQ